MRLTAFFHNRKVGKGIPYVCHPDQFPLVFGEFEFEIGIDQSSSNVGFYFRDKDHTFHVVGNLERQSRDSKEYFLNTIEKFFARVLPKGKVVLFVREKPLSFLGGRTSSVLIEVAKFFDEWTDSYRSRVPIFAGMRKEGVGKIYPGVWRKHVVDKSKGTHRSDVKIEIARDIVDKYPEFQAYFDMLSVNSDYDGFEALGILEGYIAEHGVQYIDDEVKLTLLSGDREFTGHIKLHYKLFNDPTETNFREGLDSLLGFDDDLVVLDANPDKDFYYNTRIAASTHEVCLLIYSDEKSVKSIQMMYGDMGEYKHLAVLCIRNKSMYGGMSAFLESKYYTELQTWF